MRTALVFLAALTATSPHHTAVESPNPRLTPIVQAVQKTRPGIVAVKVERSVATDGGKQSIGTGVIVDERGHIVTSYHLIHNATRVRVRLADDSEHQADIVAEDRESDLTIVRIQPKHKLQPLAFGSGSDLLVGEPVIAVGHPYGCGYTVSQGIISALNQEITLPAGPTLTRLIQTDASINPGNSGGPLLNINGEWIGVTVALRENARGIAYVHNIETVKKVLQQHLKSQPTAVKR